jgi:hypothetical protein
MVILFLAISEPLLSLLNLIYETLLMIYSNV